MDETLPRPFFRRADPVSRDSATTAPPKPRPRGPVLMGDLTGSWGGRPLILSHWDEDETG